MCHSVCVYGCSAHVFLSDGSLAPPGCTLYLTRWTNSGLCDPEQDETGTINRWRNDLWTSYLLGLMLTSSTQQWLLIPQAEVQSREETTWSTSFSFHHFYTKIEMVNVCPTVTERSEQDFGSTTAREFSVPGAEVWCAKWDQVKKK